MSPIRRELRERYYPAEILESHNRYGPGKQAIRDALDSELRRGMENYDIRTKRSLWLAPDDTCRMLDQDVLFTVGNNGLWATIGGPIVISDGCLGVLHTFYHRIVAADSAPLTRIRLLVNGEIYPGYELMFSDPSPVSSTEGHRVYGVNLAEGQSFAIQANVQVAAPNPNFQQVNFYAWEWASTPERQYDQQT